jgi:hypothetical protein
MSSGTGKKYSVYMKRGLQSNAHELLNGRSSKGRLPREVVSNGRLMNDDCEKQRQQQSKRARRPKDGG